MQKNPHPILNNFIPLVSGLAKTFGENCEVVLHDFTDLKNSIVAIENGHVTNRDINSSMPDLTYIKVKKGEIEENMINYTGKSRDGRVLKSSTFYIRDDNEKVIGCLCINFDLTELVAVKRVLNDIMKIDSDIVITKQEEESENKVNKVLEDLVTDTVNNMGKPIIYMTKEDKVNIVKKLNSQGAFLIKGSVEYLANVLCVSRFTIYNYLDEIK
jgi:predicted transcriptional regulator YheO